MVLFMYYNSYHTPLLLNRHGRRIGVFNVRGVPVKLLDRIHCVAEGFRLSYSLLTGIIFLLGLDHMDAFVAGRELIVI